MKRFLPLLILTPGMALAHAGDHGTAPFAAGLLHPVGGTDHLLAMVAVGLWAAGSGGRAVWALPLSFVAAMLVGGLLGAWGVPLPGVEPMILASVILIGVAAALVFNPGLVLSGLAVALFGLFHGHAHGTEGPVSDLAQYALGFSLATMALHGLGLAIGLGLTRVSQTGLLRGLGGATALAGLALGLS